ncbi:MAG: hypothetical protein KDI59_09960 [Xanthomonadales bacterium]|nr:hypothetical protein [Xanthomonadales bacterium]
MNHKYILLFLIFVCLCSCEDNQSVANKQYYSRYIHNESNSELKNVVVYKYDEPNIKSSVGVLIPGATKKRHFQYTPLANKHIIKWNDLDGKLYERHIDLTGMFPTHYDGGKFHITIKEDFSIYYTFVMGKTVYSPENRTAK